MLHDPDTVPALDRFARAVAVIAAGQGDDDASAALLVEALADPDATLRAHALRGLSGRGLATIDQFITAIADEDAELRAQALSLCSRLEHANDALVDAIATATRDDVAWVAVAALRALAELGLVETFATVNELATTADSPLVREEAIATLGAFGLSEGLDAIVQATSDKPAVRRRCVVALSCFEGPEVEAALDRLSEDRDWQVRQAVAMLRRESFD